MAKERKLEWDFIKGVLIILVVWVMFAHIFLVTSMRKTSLQQP